MSVAGDTLRPRLSLLVESGANRYDPVAFSFIESMAWAEGLRGMVRGIVERRALEALPSIKVVLTGLVLKQAERLQAWSDISEPRGAGQGTLRDKPVSSSG